MYATAAWLAKLRSLVHVFIKFFILHILSKLVLLHHVTGNCDLSERFLATARELDVLSPKSPDDIYKTHLVDSSAAARANRNSSAGNVPVDSARANLAATFTNAFVNAGFCKDKLIIDEDNSWLFKNKGEFYVCGYTIKSLRTVFSCSVICDQSVFLM